MFSDRKGGGWAKKWGRYSVHLARSSKEKKCNNRCSINVRCLLKMGRLDNINGWWTMRKWIWKCLFCSSAASYRASFLDPDRSEWKYLINWIQENKSNLGRELTDRNPLKVLSSFPRKLVNLILGQLIYTNNNLYIQLSTCTLILSSTFRFAVPWAGSLSCLSCCVTSSKSSR